MRKRLIDCREDFGLRLDLKAMSESLAGEPGSLDMSDTLKKVIFVAFPEELQVGD